MPEYHIIKIHSGRGNRSHIVYGQIVRADTGELCVAATLEYCIQWLKKNLTNKYGTAE